MWGEIVPLSDDIFGTYVLKNDYTDIDVVVYSCVPQMYDCKVLNEEDYVLDGQMLQIPYESVLKGVVRPGIVAITTTKTPYFELPDKSEITVPVEVPRCRRLFIRLVDYTGGSFERHIYFYNAGTWQKSFFLPEAAGLVLLRLKWEGDAPPPGTYPVLELDITYEVV